MSFTLESIFSFSILVAGVIGLVRWKHVLKSYRPFIIFIWVALLNEVISFYCIKRFGTNAVNVNIYVFAEFILLVWLFRSWSLGARAKKFDWMVVTLLFFVWLLDNLVLHNLYRFNSIFTVCYSVLVIVYSINQVNYLMITDRESLLKNARFLACTAFIVYFTYNAIVGVFYIIRPALSDKFYYNLFLVLVFVNLFSNLMYAIATAWIPTRQKFILPS